MSHDPALCDRAVCPECDAYGDGYAAGKAKSYEEIEAVLSSDHTPDCGCQPCLVVKVSRGVSERESAAGRTMVAKGTAEKPQP